MNTEKRFIALTILGVTAISVAGIVGIVSIRDVTAVVSTITTQTIPRIDDAYRLGATYRDLRLLLLSHINESDSFLKEAFAEKILQLEKEGDSILKNYQLPGHNKSEQKELINAYKEYIDIYHKALEYSKKSKIDLAQAALYGEALPATQKMEALLVKSTEKNRQDGKEANQKIERVYHNTILTFSLAVLSTALAFIILGWLLIREKLLAEKFEYHTKTDTLTGLSNRYHFDEQSQLIIKNAQISNSTLSLLFMDLNGFKLINDNFGHDIGDEILRKIGTRLKETLRKTDVIARLGGDEFIILIQPGMGYGANIVAQKIIQALSIPMSINGHEHIIFVSIGMALYPDHATNIDMLIKKADSAMYAAKKEAKEKGTGCSRLWSEEINNPPPISSR